MSDCRLYLISPPKLSAANFLIPLREALEGGDVASFQLRLKHVSDDEIRRAVDLLRPAVQANDTAFILNDRPDLAAELGCDGVH
ncbi:MAG TPA: thiamine phosphate synthase, partial [Rhizomicrobium sp.]|nr:thiamine phosphate synthase [Rhizomicrobium sp.]